MGSKLSAQTCKHSKASHAIHLRYSFEYRTLNLFTYVCRGHALQEWIDRRSSPNTRTRPHFNSGSIDSHFQRDRARIIHSASFRALQSKTQVLGLGESDFYRTRLTHSLEVAQIGFGISEHLRVTEQNKASEPWLPSFSLIESICLAHDLGHPPFGHSGEVALNYLMKDHGGFEGNGQTLRILTRLGEFSESHGLDLTRRSTLGTIKYPATYTQLASYTQPEAANSNLSHWEPPKCVYDEEQDVLAWLLEPFKSCDKNLFCTFAQPQGSHGQTQYKTLDTSIMELSDDIAYGVHDLEDAAELRLTTENTWRRHFISALMEIPANPIADNIDFFTEKLFSDLRRERKHAISQLVSYFISEVGIHENTAFHHPLLQFNATMAPTAHQILTLLKNFVLKHVILQPELQALQLKGQQMILQLFSRLVDNPQKLLPTPVYQDYLDSSNPHRVIADYIASHSDATATRLYHRLFTPGTGSIYDRF